ncbi:MAG: hypothetical protein JWP02_3721, partial [Acidimicrobiales bacterium]|nr:hypothetical protein [Acidimicrobiales bacterium]
HSVDVFVRLASLNVHSSRINDTIASEGEQVL